MGFTHFIVRLKNIARVAPGRVGDFIRSPKFGGDHIFKGEPIPIEQFNDVVPALLEKHKRSWVKLPVVELLSLTEEEEEPQLKENADSDPAQPPAEPETPAPAEDTPPTDTPKEEEPQPEESEPVADQAPDPPKKKAAKKKAAPTIADDEIARE